MSASKQQACLLYQSILTCVSICDGVITSVVLFLGQDPADVASKYFASLGVNMIEEDDDDSAYMAVEARSSASFTPNVLEIGAQPQHYNKARRVRARWRAECRVIHCVVLCNRFPSFICFLLTSAIPMTHPSTPNKGFGGCRRS